MAINLGDRYAKAIHQLLPKGPAWQEKGACTETLLGRWLRGNAEELARFQVWFDTLLKWSIERYGEMPTGWSAEEYEKLIKNKFGIDVVVTPTMVTNDPHLSTVHHRNRYRFSIEVDSADLEVIDHLFTDYLKAYKQSHTGFVLRTSAQTSLSVPHSVGMMAIKFDTPQSLQVEAPLIATSTVGLFVAGDQESLALEVNCKLPERPKTAIFVVAKQPPSLQLETKAVIATPANAAMLILGKQTDNTITASANNMNQSGMHMFAHAMG